MISGDTSQLITLSDGSVKAIVGLSEQLFSGGDIKSNLLAAAAWVDEIRFKEGENDG